MRAIAVVPVVLLHGGAVPFFGWGFIGVDVFFVISGYLITRTLLREFALNKRIDVIEFYRRRTLRLLPALLVCCGLVMALA